MTSSKVVVYRWYEYPKARDQYNYLFSSNKYATKNIFTNACRKTGFDPEHRFWTPSCLLEAALMNEVEIP